MLLLSGLALLCFAAAAQAAGFSAPQYLSPAGGDAGAPQLAIDSQDRATVVWVRSDGTNDRVESVRLDADGTPGAVQTLSGAGQDATAPQLAIDSQDRATVVWVRSDGTNDRVQSVRLDGDGDLEGVQDLSASGQDAFAPQLAIDSQDRATVVWSRSDGTNGRIQSVLLGADGEAADVQDLSAAGKGAFSPELAIDSQDRVTVAWVRGDETFANAFRVQVVRLDADGNPGTLHETPSPTLNIAPSTPQIAIDSQDRATLVWRLNNGMHRQVVAWRFDADANPLTTSEQYLSPDGEDSGGPQLSFDSQDRATVVWTSDVEITGDTYRQIQSVRLGSDGSPEPLQLLSARGQHAAAWDMATDTQDVATVVEVRSDGSNNRVQFQRSGDTIAPDTQVDSPAEGSTVTDPSPVITFSSDQTDYIDHFECTLDDLEFSQCSSPFTYGPLAEGPHAFEVRAVDMGGDIDPTPATLHFTVAAPPPTGPTDPTPPTGGTAGQVATSKKCKKIRSHKRRKKCAKRAKQHR